MLAQLIVALYASALVSAQTVVNGQIFTPGLSIVDAPAVNSVYHAGSNMPIAIDVSGDGHLQTAAQIPGSNFDTRFDSLEIFLVSGQTNLNLTVSAGAGLLTQESGSTVKHLNFDVPTCITPGEYNLTFYEYAHISGNAHFTITPIPLQVQNTAQSAHARTERTASSRSRNPPRRCLRVRF